MLWSASIFRAAAGVMLLAWTFAGAIPAGNRSRARTVTAYWTAGLGRRALRRCVAPRPRARSCDRGAPRAGSASGASRCRSSGGASERRRTRIRSAGDELRIAAAGPLASLAALLGAAAAHIVIVEVRARGCPPPSRRSSPARTWRPPAAQRDARAPVRRGTRAAGGRVGVHPAPGGGNAARERDRTQGSARDVRGRDARVGVRVHLDRRVVAALLGFVVRERS